MTSSSFVVADGAALDTSVGAAINGLYLAPETGVVRGLADRARLAPDRRDAVQKRALALVNAVRGAKPSGSGLDAFLREYHLGSREGVILMCLAEALLRIPDAETADRLIADKIPAGDWEDHLGDSDSLFVNASTWGLMLTGRIVDVDRAELGSVRSWFSRLTSRIGEPVARAALRQAMRILGHQFVMGRTIEEALERTHGSRERAYRYSFDMLGESALTSADAERYFEKEDPLGSRIRLGADLDRGAEDLAAPWLTIVGVSPPVFQQSPNQDLRVQPTVYEPFRQDPPGSFTVLARSSLAGDAVVQGIRSEMRQLDADLPLYNIRTMDDIIAQRNWPYRIFGTLFGTFAVIALLISSVGIYAATAHGIGQRTQELGVRMALGAARRDILWLVLRQGLTRIAIGMVIGVSAAIGVSRVLASVLVNTSATDPATFVSICLLLAAVTLLACIVPARRATRLDPVDALRTE